MTNEGTIFIDGQFRDPKTCPISKDNICPEDGSKLEAGYGFAGGYGLGMYDSCPKCHEIYNFVEDPE